MFLKRSYAGASHDHYTMIMCAQLCEYNNLSTKEPPIKEFQENRRLILSRSRRKIMSRVGKWTAKLIYNNDHFHSGVP